MKKYRRLRPALRLLVAAALCSAGAALGMLGFATPAAPKGTTTAAVTRTSVPPTLARPEPAQLGMSGSFLTELQRLLSPSEWLASFGHKRALLRRSVTAPQSAAPRGGTLVPVVGEAVIPTVSLPVRDLPVANEFSPWVERPEELRLNNRGPQTPKNPLELDPVLQLAAPAAGTAMPPLGSSFEGMSMAQACGSCFPPDTNGAVGPNHYVQMVNSHFAIYSKTGAVVSPPKAINMLWSSTPNSTCATHNNGDPIVLYDQLADRWLLSQFTVQTGTENYAECIAISQTPDPTGAYWLYQFDESADTFHDYPHIGIWPDGYYMTTNLFPNDALLTSTGAGAWAFERPKMLLGQAARYVYFDETPLATQTYTPGGQLPTCLDGKNPPPAGMPNYIIEVNDANQPNTPPATGLHDEMHIWKFQVDWTNPANSTFGTGSSAPVAKPGFSGQFAGNAGQPNFKVTIADFVPTPCQIENGPNGCSPEKENPPQAPQYLDVLGDRLMHRVTYRNFGDHESLLVQHTVAAVADEAMGGTRNAVRWYEVRNVSMTPAVYQQGTFAPFDPANPLWRWMGSAAIDHSGNIAIGYSSSGPNQFPSLHYAGRLVGDPLNQLAQGEALMFAGLGNEIQTGVFPLRNRWGDYSALTVDPSDDCTFWYTNEYIAANNFILGVDWRTRIGSFRFPQCVAAAPVQLVSAASRKTHGGAGVFDIPLPQSGPRGVECRTGGANGDYTIVFTFATPITSCGTASAGTVHPGSSPNECAVDLTGVPNGQYFTVSLTNVFDNQTNSGNFTATMGVLLGDVTANGVVSNTDVSAIKTQVAAPVTAGNFRDDVNANGVISNTDVSLTKAQVGTTLP
jgi:hypothetical protein